MRMFARTKPASVSDRRNGPRTRVDCLATLLMPSGNRTGRLFDISTHGARIVTQDPPAKGVSAILDWHTHEAYCRVIWTKPGMCGVKFDRPIPAKIVEELAETAPASPRLVHSASNDGFGASPAGLPTRFVG